MFQNKFEIKIFENGGDIILSARSCWKNVLRDTRCSSYKTYLKQIRLEFSQTI